MHQIICPKCSKPYSQKLTDDSVCFYCGSPITMPLPNPNPTDGASSEVEKLAEQLYSIGDNYHSFNDGNRDWIHQQDSIKDDYKRRAKFILDREQSLHQKLAQTEKTIIQLIKERDCANENFGVTNNAYVREEKNVRIHKAMLDTLQKDFSNLVAKNDEYKLSLAELEQQKGSK